MICCVTGHRPKGFPFPRNADGIAYYDYLEKLYFEIEFMIREGYHHFISGMAEGADIDFSSIVLFHRNEGEAITLEAALPYPIIPPKINTDYTAERDMLLLQCNQKHIVSPYYHKGCFMQRNRYMVDQSDLVFAIWNGSHYGGTWNTIQYAEATGKPVRYLLLRNFCHSLLTP